MDELTKQKILNMIHDGYSNTEISKEVGYSNQHISAIKKKYYTTVRDMRGRSTSRQIARFEKVPFGQFARDWREMIDADADNGEIREIYDAIRLPVRATTGSAGYDFFSPMYLYIKPGQARTFPSGIRVQMEDSWALMLIPKSSLGVKYRLNLSNSVGLIDSDYYYAKNKGHIMIALVNNGDTVCVVEEGKACMQGVFVEYGLTVDDQARAVRKGGFGSTGA